MYGGRQLLAGRGETLADYGIQSLATLYMLQRLRGGVFVEVIEMLWSWACIAGVRRAFANH